MKMAKAIRIVLNIAVFIDVVLGFGDHCYQSDKFKMEIDNLRLTENNFVVANNEYVCSTWGNGYFNTFDGYFYNGKGNCTSIFTQHCRAPNEDFKILIKRNTQTEKPEIEYIFMKLFYNIIEVNKTGIYVNGKQAEVPYKSSNLNIDSEGVDVVFSISGIRVQWNTVDALQVVLPDNYKNQTCGLCGDYNGFKYYNEGFKDEDQGSIDEFVAKSSAEIPGEVCVQSSIPISPTCERVNETCRTILQSPELSDCVARYDLTPYLQICESDSCACSGSESQTVFCLCSTLSEFSKQCANANGKPQNWRNQGICKLKCPPTMEYKECGSACEKTCTNQEPGACIKKCVSGCFCPNGTVFDDVRDKGCIPPSECYCKFSGLIYPTGAELVLPCENCTCVEGMWKCTRKLCSGSCSVEGGSYITTFDQRGYNFHGDCSYILTQLCALPLFTVHGEINSCNLNEFETCLSKIILIIREPNTRLLIKNTGEVSVNSVTINLPYEDGNLTIFEPTSFYIIVNTNFGLRLDVQLVPLMQVYIYLESSYFGLTCGLCGNFNDKQFDDFVIPNGMSVQDLDTFTYSWRSEQTCLKVSTDVIDPCSINIQKESYASLWCSKLNSKDGVFAVCHHVVNPAPFYLRCLYDTCLCKNSEKCMCAAISSYVRACARRGVIIGKWRIKMCDKYIKDCLAPLVYQDNVNTCQATCKSLSTPDRSCTVDFTPIDGCICTKGLYLTQYGNCVPESRCPCYHRGIYHNPGEKLYKNGVECVCRNGKLYCDYSNLQNTNCTLPMVYFNCSREPVGATGIECLESCQNLNVDCYSNECVSGCVCPRGTLADGKGRCVPSNRCTCFYNDKIYNHNEKAKIGCRICTCINRKWICDHEGAQAECLVYGEGNYITFDKKHYRYSGQCEYTLVQDFCGTDVTDGTFRIIIENTKCSDTGLTCAKTIRVFLYDFILHLSQGQASIDSEGSAAESPFKIWNTSLYLIISVSNGLVLIWDKKTSLTIKITGDFQHNVCGLCGNYDGNSNNDFTTRSNLVVEDVMEFGNSWKLSPSCPETDIMVEPCELNPHRKSWSQRQCGIILTDPFKSCHTEVDPSSYYQACVKDSCACDEGGDCDCYCTAIAAYAQECLAHCICVEWRTPNRCPVFCDYYNHEDDCEWHYKACGAPCMKTCRNPSGNCSSSEPTKVEGCYPECPGDKPFFEELSMQCVNQCGCYDHMGHYYKPGDKIISCNNCESCNCTINGIYCEYDTNACYCEYNGHIYAYNETIYTEDIGNGICLVHVCSTNGTMTQYDVFCESTSTRTTQTSTVTITSKKVTARSTPTTTKCVCTFRNMTYDPDTIIYITYENNTDCGNKVICDRLCYIKTVPLSCTTQLTSTTKRTTTVSRRPTTRSSTFRKVNTTVIPTRTSTTVTPTKSTLKSTTTRPSTTYKVTARSTTSATTTTRFSTTTVSTKPSTTSKTSSRATTFTTKTPTSTVTSKSTTPSTTLTKTSTTVTPTKSTLTSTTTRPSTTSKVTASSTTSATTTTRFSTTTVSTKPSTTSKTSSRATTFTTKTPTSTVTSKSTTPSTTLTRTSTTVTPTKSTLTSTTTRPSTTSKVTASSTTSATTTTRFSTTTVSTKPSTTSKTSSSTTTFTTKTPTSTVTSKSTTPSTTLTRTSTTVTPTKSTLTSTTTRPSTTSKVTASSTTSATTTTRFSTTTVSTKPSTTSKTSSSTTTFTTKTPTSTVTSKSTTPSTTLTRTSTTVTPTKSTLTSTTRRPSTTSKVTASSTTSGTTVTFSSISTRGTEIYTYSRPIGTAITGIFENPTPTTLRSTTPTQCNAVSCPEGSMFNITDLDCVNGTRPFCTSELRRVYDHKLCCFIYICPFCLLENGDTFQPGESWIQGCLNCTCLGSAEITCLPISCPPVVPLTCDQPGYQLMMVKSQDDPCCFINQCVCNVNLCDPLISSCPSGLVPFFSMVGCCVKITCVPETKITIPTTVASLPGTKTTKTTTVASLPGTKITRASTVSSLPGTKITRASTVSSLPVTTKTTTVSSLPGTKITRPPTVSSPPGVCIINNSTYTEGQSVPSPDDKCIYFICVRSAGQLVVVTVAISCEHYSSKDCKYGEEYVPPTDLCCGKCVQKFCVVITTNGTATLLKEGESFSSPGDYCTKYKCVKSRGQLVTITEKEICKYNSSKDCNPGEEYVPPTKQCCGECVQKFCVIRMPNGDTKLLNAGQSFPFPGDYCKNYTCVKSGGQLVTVIEKEICKYNSSKDCKPGEEYVPPTKLCCGECVQKFCVIRTPNGDTKLLNEGESFPFPGDYCKKYTCVKSGGQLVIVIEKEICKYNSSKDCKPGEEYVPPTNKCCGECVQKLCVFTTPSGDIKLLKEGESFSFPRDYCTKYTCVKSGGQLVIVTEKEICKYNSAKDCKPGEEYVPPTNKCCGECVQKWCAFTTPSGDIKLLKEGESFSFPRDYCRKYTCVKSGGQLVIVMEKEICKDCQLGEEYVPPTNQCCGQCVQKFCVFTTPTGDIKLLKEGESFSSPRDYCTKYTCVKSDRLLVIVVEKEICKYKSSKDCKPGEEYVPPINQCCGQCVLRFCVFTTLRGDTKLLNPGESWPDPSNICIVYTCISVNNQLFAQAEKKKCEILSAQDCKKGEVYNITTNECCGKCIPAACSIVMPNGTSTTLKPGELWQSPTDKCVSYDCRQSNKTFFPVLINKTCEIVKPEDCETGTIEVSADGCCSKCKAQKNCTLQVGLVTLLSGDCPLNLTIPYCTGICSYPTMTKTFNLEPECKCCKQLKAREKIVNVNCRNGTSISYIYNYIEKCGCGTLECE